MTSCYCSYCSCPCFSCVDCISLLCSSSRAGSSPSTGSSSRAGASHGDVLGTILLSEHLLSNLLRHSTLNTTHPSCTSHASFQTRDAICLLFYRRAHSVHRAGVLIGSILVELRATVIDSELLLFYRLCSSRFPAIAIIPLTGNTIVEPVHELSFWPMRACRLTVRRTGGSTSREQLSPVQTSMVSPPNLHFVNLSNGSAGISPDGSTFGWD